MGTLLIRKWCSIVLVLVFALPLLLLAGCSGDEAAKDDKGPTAATEAAGAKALAIASGPTGSAGAKGAGTTPATGATAATDAAGAKALTIATGPAGATAAAGTDANSAANERCTICHGEGAMLDVATMHPENAAALEYQVLTVTVTAITDTGGGILQVAFTVKDESGAGVEGIPFDAARLYLADIVPQGTDTSWGTFDTDYLERWAQESSSDAVPGVWADLSGGGYTYTFVTALGSDAALTEAPDYDPTDVQRLVIRIAGDDDSGYFNTIGIQDFMVDGTLLVPERVLAPVDGCKKCHSRQMLGAAHSDAYLDTRACVVCHSPIGHYGTTMQEDDAYLSVFIHGIHAAKSSDDLPGFAEFEEGGGHERFPDANSIYLGYAAVTYPQDIKNCTVCHTGNGNMTDGWKSNPTAEVCGSCHTDVNFATGEGHGNLPGSVMPPLTNNDFCAVCHPPERVTAVHEVTITHVVTSSIKITPDNNGDDVYEAGEAPMVTITVEIDGEDVGGYTDADHVTYRNARLYVYGPRAKAVPVLTLGSTTDSDYDPAVEGTPSQSHDLYVGSDAQVMTDAEGFKYQLLPIPDDLAPGTYMVMARINVVGESIEDGYALTTFQVGTATEELKVAGDGCSDCHNIADYSSMHHRSYFGTDGCLACHDQSGILADPLANRVHAVHAAAELGDLLAKDWSEVTFPQSNVAEGEKESSRCVGCHDSGNTSYLTNPVGAACLGCHGDNAGARDHMIQMGSDFPAE